MKKSILVILSTLILLFTNLPTTTASTNNDIHVNTKLKLYFHGKEDVSGKSGMYDNGTSYIPKAIVYADTTYVPIRYFANMLGISQVGWDGDIPLIWVDSNKPVIEEPVTKVSTKLQQPTVVEGSIVTDQSTIKPMKFFTYPNLRLFFQGEEDTSGNEGLFFNGYRDIPKTLIYQGATYVPLRYFATQLGIPNEQVRWDAKVPALSIGGEAPTEQNNPIVTIEMDNGSKITLELYPEKAPNTVTNFVSLIQEGFYDGLIFHRVIPGFVIQGGDPNGTGTGGPGYSIAGEFTSNRFVNDILHERGVLSMARAQDPNSAGSQFFIMLDSQPHLDGLYAAFGKVLTGMEVVDQIVATPRDQMDKPIEKQTIKSMTVDTFGKDYGEPVKLQ